MLKTAHFVVIGALGLTTAFPSMGQVVIAPEDNLVITESFDENTQQGFYHVENNTVDFSLIGFGVSNMLSQASIGTYGDNFACSGSYCYDAQTITEFEWGTQTAYFDFDIGQSQTFQQAFGDFSSNVEPGEYTINWYSAVDGALNPGDSDDFFLFQALSANSIALGVLASGSETVTFQQLQVSQVPLPAAAWLFGSAFLGLGLLKRRKV